MNTLYRTSQSRRKLARTFACIYSTFSPIIIFLRILSDNGAWTEKGLDGGSNGLLRGQKGETYEGGMRYAKYTSQPFKILTFPS